MSTQSATTTQEVSCEVVCIRCGCSLEQKAAADWHARRGEPCPHPRAIEDFGRVAYWHRNPFRRLAWRLGRWLRGKRAGAITLR